MYTIDIETFENLRTSFEYISKKLDKLNKLDQIHQTLKDIQSSYEANLKCNGDKKNNEHVKKHESAKGGDESVEINIESKSGDYEQNLIVQKATKAIKIFRRVKKPRRPSPARIILKVSINFTFEEFSYRLKKNPSKVFRRKKKYKWDDGG